MKYITMVELSKNQTYKKKMIDDVIGPSIPIHRQSVRPSAPFELRGPSRLSLSISSACSVKRSGRLGGTM